MDNRSQLESLSKNFSLDGLTDFLRKASGKFKPEKDDYRHFLDGGNLVRSLHKLGKIEFEDGRRLIVLAGALDGELTSQSGKLGQFEVARKVLKAEYWDAGIFVFHDDKGNFRFSLITASYTGAKREFSNFRRYTYFVSPEGSARTFVEQIGRADFSSIEKITEAFSVEPVTKEFFRQFREIFEEAEATIKLKWSEEKKRLYTQRFFNRVLFITFLERKGWLTFNGRKDYLKALFADYYENTRDKNANFHRSRLNTLFFMGLNHPSGDKRQKAEYKPILSLIGDVPYLNGGLFEEEEDDKDGPTFSDAIIAKVLNELVYQFNFTVTESTPLDVEVAVDPEMLGRIFEELVTGRHESGSYYTPKPVVAFMCREALKGYLATALPAESAEGLALFVDKNDAKLVRNPMQVVDALRAVKVCDPACGSGAYLLGMLHELLEQYAVIFAQHQKDGQTIYQTKLDIIQNNLYGVDKDDFAVNIARLRLWLSLIVDFEGGTPPPLPNLDFKIECGDSLTAPDPSGGLQPDMFRYGQVRDFLALKNEFMDLHEGSEKKKKLGKQIDELKKQIEEWAHPKGYDKESDSFDWQVDFAEVFAPELAQSTLGGKMAGMVNTTKGQMELTDAPKEGGFDIILANPPYGATVDTKVRDIYFDSKSENGQSRDTYGLFIVRALQLLRRKGQFCFIVSDTWRTIETHKYLRKKILKSTTVAHVIDLPSWIFNATVNTSILTLSKTIAPDSHKIITSELRGINPGDWKTLTENLLEIANHGLDNQTPEFARYTYPQKLIETYENCSFFIGSPKLYKMMSDASLMRFGTIAEIKYGIRTGNNARFFLQKPEVRGSYKDITPLMANVLTESELENLTQNEMLNGISVKKKKYIVPLNKGGESNADEKWLPKYFVPTGYFFDWSEDAVAHLKKIKGMRNPEIHFKKGLTFSWTGEYAPTFRVAHLGVYDQSSSSIQNIQVFEMEELLGILNSKFIKYQIKNFIDHSVNSDIGVISSISLPTLASPERKKISDIVKKIIKKQMSEERYDYSQEAQEIDLLVYKIFNLNKEDINDVETWYKRRYPKLR